MRRGPETPLFPTVEVPGGMSVFRMAGPEGVREDP